MLLQARRLMQALCFTVTWACLHALTELLNQCSGSQVQARHRIM